MSAPITIPADATGAIEGAHLAGMTLTNNGTLAWLSGTLLGDDNAILQNNGTLLIVAGTTSFGYGTEVNAGTINVTGLGSVTGSVPWAWAFHNTSTGVVDVGSGATFEWQQGGDLQHYLDGGTQITGGGALLFDASPMSGASVVTVTGTIAVAAGATLAIGSGATVEFALVALAGARRRPARGAMSA